MVSIASALILLPTIFINIRGTYLHNIEHGVQPNRISLQPLYMKLLDSGMLTRFNESDSIQWDVHVRDAFLINPYQLADNNWKYELTPTTEKFKYLFGLGYLYIFPDSRDKDLKMCFNIGGGVGNLLSEYWTARALATYFSFTFIFTDNMPTKGCLYDRAEGRKHQFNANNTFTHYLSHHVSSKQVSQDIKVMFSGSINLKHFTLLRRLLTHAAELGDSLENTYTYSGPLLFSFYNRYFISVLSADSNKAMNEYYKNMKHTKPVLGENDCAIHIRCGDIFGLKDVHYHGFMTLKYYETAFNITNWTSKLEQNATIYLQTQLGSNSNHNVYGMRNIEQCEELVSGIADFLRHRYSTQVEVIGDATISDDMYRMMHAPLLICGMSSFCIQGAAANSVGSVVLPTCCVWDFKWIDHDYTFLPDNHHAIDVGIDSKLYMLSAEQSANYTKASQLLSFLVNN